MLAGATLIHFFSKYLKEGFLAGTLRFFYHDDGGGSGGDEGVVLVW